MKAITLTQPWASFVAIGAKRIETRSWRTDYRGPIAIHAAKGFGGLPPGRTLADICLDEPFRSVLWEAGVRRFVPGQDLPLGAIVATANLTACIETANPRWRRAALVDPAHPHEEAFGDYGPGRFMWFLADVVALPEPIPARGMQGLWEWEPPQ